MNEGYQIDEYEVPRKAFEKEGFRIETASRYGGKVQLGKKYQNDHAPVMTDLSFDQVRVADYDAITFAGGAGAWTDYFPNLTLHRVLLQAVEDKSKIVGLICAGTGVLATANNLDGKTPQFKGRHVTGYAEVSGLLRLHGQVNYNSGNPSKPDVVQAGNLITGRDPLSASLFAQNVIERLRAKR